MIAAAALRHIGAVLVVGSVGGAPSVWDAHAHERLAAITLDTGVDAVWVVHNADAIAALSTEGHLHVLDLVTRSSDRDPAHILS